VPLLWRSDGDRGRVFLSCRQGPAVRQFAESDLDGQMLAAAIDRETDLVPGGGRRPAPEAGRPCPGCGRSRSSAAASIGTPITPPAVFTRAPPLPPGVDRRAGLDHARQDGDGRARADGSVAARPAAGTMPRAAGQAEQVADGKHQVVGKPSLIRVAKPSWLQPGGVVDADHREIMGAGSYPPV
jgi:hypothetical protein